MSNADLQQQATIYKLLLSLSKAGMKEELEKQLEEAIEQIRKNINKGE
ncbi:MAG: hypothetical protein FWF50_02310 [Defluviitaleaceae bacterium]|nr:hypothetical protein [Defluviitaleaceae bacterium]